MSLRSTRTALAGVAAIATVATSAHAQSAQRWSVQASGIAVGVSGNAYDGLATGYGFEVQGRLTPSLWSYGVGIQSSIHELSQLSSQTVSLTGIFFEPRRVFDIGSAKYAPYASARLAYLQQSAELGLALNQVRSSAEPVALSIGAPRDVSLSTAAASGTTLSASGVQGNIGGGVLVKMSPRVNLDLGITLGAIRFGDAKLDFNGNAVGTFDGTSGTGQNAVVRVGVAIGLGGGKPKPKPPAPAPTTTQPRR